SLEKSLRRLKTDRVDMFLLHGPPREILSDGRAIGSLRRFQSEGKAQCIGVSSEDIDGGLVALDDLRVQVIELPLWPWTELSEQFLEKARRRGVVVIARGLMSATMAGISTPEKRALSIQDSLRLAVSLAGVHRILIGTTRIEHLRQVLGVLQN